MKILVTLPKGSVSDTFLTPQALEKMRTLTDDITFNPHERHYTREELKEAIRDKDIVFCGWGSTRYDAEILDEAPNLKVIAYVAGSVAAVADAAIYERGIAMLGANCVFAESVAECCICYTMVGLRRIEKYSKLMRDGGWKDSTFYNEGIMDRTVGLVGFGTVAKKFIEFLRPFKTRILVNDDYLTEETAAKYGVEKVSMEEVFRTSDVVSIQHSLTDRTYHLVGREQLEMMKEGALLINTARGSIINETELIDFLQTGKINAVLDVYEQEPPLPDGILRKLPNVTLLPHMGGPTIDRRAYCTMALADDIRKLFAGTKVEDLETYIPLSHVANMTNGSRT